MRAFAAIIKVGCLCLTVFLGLILAVVVFSDSPPIGCPNYGIVLTKTSPDGAWIAESGVEGCLQGGDTFILIRKSDEPFDYRPSKRVVSFSDFPTIRFNWGSQDVLEIGVSRDISDMAFPPEWRGIKLQFRSFDESNDEKSRHLVIGHGTVWYER
jgi:hypothetical protein